MCPLTWGNSFFTNHQHCCVGETQTYFSGWTRRVGLCCAFSTSVKWTWCVWAGCMIWHCKTQQWLSYCKYCLQAGENEECLGYLTTKLFAHWCKGREIKHQVVSEWHLRGLNPQQVFSCHLGESHLFHHLWNTHLQMPKMRAQEPPQVLNFKKNTAFVCRKFPGRTLVVAL